MAGLGSLARHDQNRFNVAALRGARKYGDAVGLVQTFFMLQCGRAPRSAEMSVKGESIPPVVVLQCGRAPRSAEIEIKPLVLRPDDTASMWPRSEERGNTVSNTNTVTVTKLQCGRAPRSAEMRSGRAGTADIRSLQCGRAPRSAEIRAYPR